jgi:hypothetical protein
MESTRTHKVLPQLVKHLTTAGQHLIWLAGRILNLPPHAIYYIQEIFVRFLDYISCIMNKKKLPYTAR